MEARGRACATRQEAGRDARLATAPTEARADDHVTTGRPAAATGDVMALMARVSALPRDRERLVELAMGHMGPTVRLFATIERRVPGMDGVTVCTETAFA